MQSSCTKWCHTCNVSLRIVADRFRSTVYRFLCEVETEPLSAIHTWLSLQWVVNLIDGSVHSSLNTGNT